MTHSIYNAFFNTLLRSPRTWLGNVCIFLQPTYKRMICVEYVYIYVNIGLLKYTRGATVIEKFNFYIFLGFSRTRTLPGLPNSRRFPTHGTAAASYSPIFLQSSDARHTACLIQSKGFFQQKLFIKYSFHLSCNKNRELSDCIEKIGNNFNGKF